jgi:hypothetical protein
MLIKMIQIIKRKVQFFKSIHNVKEKTSLNKQRSYDMYCIHSSFTLLEKYGV